MAVTMSEKARVEANGHLPGWFEVDRAGLARQQASKHPAFAAFELIQNGLDQNVTRVTVTLEADKLLGYTMITVEDDDPDGFTDISHAYTMFARSEKIYDARKRGQFNVGEKYVLAISKYAELATVSGTIIFHEDGTRQQLGKGTKKGTIFKALVRMNTEQRAETEVILQTLIPPPGIVVTVNGVKIKPRTALKEIVASLNTMVPDRENAMRPTIRKTIVRVYPVRKGEVATLYERGIPVLPLGDGDKWHYDIDQKVMLSIDRDNVRPAYLKRVRLVVVNAMYESMTDDDWNADWGKQVCSDPAISTEAFKASVKSRFGDKVVRRDLKDQEANNLAVSLDYTVVEPRTLSKEEWKNAKRVGNIKLAGLVTPSHSTLERKITDGGNIPEKNWSVGEHRLARYAKALAKLLIERDITVELFSDITNDAQAAYSGRTGGLIFNRAHMSHQFGPNYGTEITEGIDALLFHELAHETASNHLDHGFHDAICALAAKAIRLAPAIRLAADETIGARRQQSQVRGHRAVTIADEAA